MLDSLTLESFKCFAKLDLPLRRFTFLTGLNGSGKSSLIQALAVLKQTLQSDVQAERLILNGSEATLGTFNRLVHDLTDGSRFAIGISSGDERFLWDFEGDRQDITARIVAATVNRRRYAASEGLQFLLPRGEVTRERRAVMESIATANFLTSERPTPEAVHKLALAHPVKSIGRDGRHAVGLLHMLRDELVEQGVRHPDIQNMRLIAQVEGWMRHLFPGFRMQVVSLPDSNLVTLGIRLSDASNFHEPAHTGYGLTQLLPVIVAALVARPGEILAVENPENDLHPRGQALIGEFLCRVAATGVQILVESHSDHVLNGIRRSVKQGTIGHRDSIIHFLGASDEVGPSIDTLELDANGAIESWPLGFFDQLDRDLEYFADWES